MSENQFYTVQEIPGFDSVTDGEWDLRENVDAYLGDVDFKGRSVLELGPSSGFLTFHMERKGGGNRYRLIP